MSLQDIFLTAPTLQICSMQLQDMAQSPVRELIWGKHCGFSPWGNRRANALHGLHQNNEMTGGQKGNAVKQRQFETGVHQASGRVHL